MALGFGPIGAQPLAALPEEPARDGDALMWAKGRRQTAHFPEGGMWSVSARQVVLDGSATSADVPDDLYLVGGTALGFGAPLLVSTSKLHAPSVKVEPPQGVGPGGLHVNRNQFFPASIIVEPGPQKLAHDALVQTIDELRAEVQKLTATRMGHNNPPSAIDDAPEVSAAQLVEMVQALDILRQSPPAPRNVPEPVQEARQTLSRIYMEALARRGGEVTAETLAAWAKTCVNGAVLLLLFKVIEASGVWIELIKLAAKAAGR